MILMTGDARASIPVLFVFMLHRHIHRTYVPEGIYFVTTDVRWHVPLFAKAVIAQIVERTIWHERTSCFLVYAYVIMQDHMHLLIQPTKGEISTIIQSIKSNSCREVNRYFQKQHSGERALAAMGDMGVFRWQKGFYDHVIKDDRDFRNHIEYIRYNPVKASLVEKPEEHPFLFVDEEAVWRMLG